MDKLEQHTIFLGLNDGTTKQQEISTDKAIEMVSNVISGGSISTIQGVYTHEDGTKVKENTLKIDILYSDDATVRLYASDLKRLFNQESVLISKGIVNGMFV